MNPRLYRPRLAAGPLALEGADFRYLGRVLRLRAGAPVTLFDGAGGEADARVAHVHGERGLIELAVDAPRAAAEGAARRSITLRKAEGSDTPPFASAAV